MVVKNLNIFTHHTCPSFVMLVLIGCTFHSFSQTYFHWVVLLSLLYNTLDISQDVLRLLQNKTLFTFGSCDFILTGLFSFDILAWLSRHFPLNPQLFARSKQHYLLHDRTYCCSLTFTPIANMVLIRSDTFNRGLFS